MRGDFSRDTFNKTRHFSRVLEQQGRPQLDADFNEQAAILLHYLRTLAEDIGGPSWGPSDHFGFELRTATDENGRPTDDGDFVIGEGRYYVDGILCENNDAGAKFGDQAGVTEDDLPESGKAYYAYLDVWERHVTYIQEEYIRETALGAGGPDTSTRAQVVWQVKLVDIAEEERTLKEHLEKEKDADARTRLEQRLKDLTLDCRGAGAWVAANSKLSLAMLKAHLETERGDDNACSIPPESRYRGAENQLYRIEVHRGGLTDEATFKWSRDNGSVVFPIVKQNGQVVTLQSLGRDQRTGLMVNDWVEIVDDGIELRGESGIVAQVDDVDPVEMTVTLKLPRDADPDDPGFRWPTYPAKIENHPLLRRWDHGSVPGIPMALGALLIREGDKDWIKIEHGIEIQFQTGGEYRTGDYWMIPARVATGKIEWPLELKSDGTVVTDGEGNEVAQSLPPHGIEHHYAPLGLIDDQAVTEKCRCRLYQDSSNDSEGVTTFKLDCIDPVAKGMRAASGASKTTGAKKTRTKSG